MSERKLVTVRKIDSIETIEDADSIEVAVLGGWKAVVRKDEVKKGELVAYFEIDSLIPVKPWSEFLLKGSSLKTVNIDGKEYSGVRLRTKKLRGVISQGLVVKLSVG